MCPINETTSHSIETPCIATGTPCTATENPAAKKVDRRRLNAWRHGLTGQICFHSPYERELYDAHCKGIHESLAAGNAFETGIVQQIADDRWRLNRAFAIEQSIFAGDGVNAPKLHEH